MSASVPAPDPTQLIRYILQMDAISTTANIGRIRQVLTDLHLLVDRIEAGEAEVAVLPDANPGPERIREALHAAGFAVQDITAIPG